MNMKVTELEHHKNCKYLGINEMNDVNHTIKKEKNKKIFP